MLIESPLSRGYILRAMPDFPDILRSTLCQTVTRDGVTVQVEIYRLEDSESWTLELVDEGGGSIVWKETFATDAEALAEFNEGLEELGLAKLLEPTRANSLPCSERQADDSSPDDDDPAHEF